MENEIRASEVMHDTVALRIKKTKMQYGQYINATVRMSLKQ